MKNRGVDSILRLIIEFSSPVSRAFLDGIVSSPEPKEQAGRHGFPRPKPSSIQKSKTRPGKSSRQSQWRRRIADRRSRIIIPHPFLPFKVGRSAFNVRCSLPLSAPALHSCVLRLASSSLESPSFFVPLPFKLNSDLSFTASATKENFFSLLNDLPTAMPDCGYAKKEYSRVLTPHSRRFHRGHDPSPALRLLLVAVHLCNKETRGPRAVIQQIG